MMVKKIVTTTTTTYPVASTVIGTEQFPDLLANVLSARVSDLQRQLALVDETRAWPLRSELDQINTQIVSLRSCLSFDEALSIAQNLDTINDQALTMAPVVQMSPLVIVEPSGARRIAGTNVEIF
jgi:hypothetical protein